MVTHPFGTANLSGASPEQFAALFAADVSFHTPILTKPVRGKAMVLPVLAYAVTLTGKPRYTLEIRADRQTVLLWNGTVEGYALQAATVLTDDAAGQIGDITILMRPYPLVTRFQQAMYQHFASSIPADYWVLAAEPASRPHHQAASATLPPADLSLAPDVTLHSPVLTKEVRGKDQVGALLKAVNAIYGARVYQATFSTPTQRIALWEAPINGYTAQGLSINTLDAEERIIEITELMRPWPVVALVRDALLAQSLMFLTPDYWTLPERPAKGAASDIPKHPAWRGGPNDEYHDDTGEKGRAGHRRL